MMVSTLLLLLVAGQQAEPATAPPPPPAKEKQICRTEDTTGSRMGGRRVCRTKEQWDAISANARKTMDDAMARSPAPSVR
jgi:Spy/CpxP family protein refolding chaperone